MSFYDLTSPAFNFSVSNSVLDAGFTIPFRNSKRQITTAREEKV
jgi:hypothetical protein